MFLSDFYVVWWFEVGWFRERKNNDNKVKGNLGKIYKNLSLYFVVLLMRCGGFKGGLREFWFCCYDDFFVYEERG